MEPRNFLTASEFSIYSQKIVEENLASVWQKKHRGTGLFLLMGKDWFKIDVFDGDIYAVAKTADFGGNEWLEKIGNVNDLFFKKPILTSNEKDLIYSDLIFVRSHPEPRGYMGIFCPVVRTAKERQAIRQDWKDKRDWLFALC